MKKMLHITSILTIILGFLCVIGGTWGMIFTYQNINAEEITTPSDAELPDTRVRGPLSLLAQANVIRDHTLEITDGKRYAQMPRFVALTDNNGEVVYDQNGDPVLVENETRAIWITATALISALYLAIMGYVLSGIILLLGLISLWTGATFYYLGRKHK